MKRMHGEVKWTCRTHWKVFVPEPLTNVFPSLTPPTVTALPIPTSTLTLTTPSAANQLLPGVPSAPTGQSTFPIEEKAPLAVEEDDDAVTEELPFVNETGERPDPMDAKFVGREEGESDVE